MKELKIEIFSVLNFKSSKDKVAEAVAVAAKESETLKLCNH